MDNCIDWGIGNCLELADFALSISHYRRFFTDMRMVVPISIFLSKGVWIATLYGNTYDRNCTYTLSVVSIVLAGLVFLLVWYANIHIKILQDDIHKCFQP